MTDQCIHCTVRGNLDECKQTKCFQHESWYAQQMIAEIERNRAAIAELVAALKDCTKFAHRNHCSHDETYRAGSIWEVCSMCGAKWADDEGGKPDYIEPVELTKAYEALTKHTSTVTKGSN